MERVAREIAFQAASRGFELCYSNPCSDSCCQLLGPVFVRQTSYPLRNFGLLRIAKASILEFGIHDHLLDYYFFRYSYALDSRLIHVWNHQAVH